MNNAEFQKKQEKIRKGLSILFRPGDIIHVRALKTNWGTISGYYDDFDQAAEDIAALSYNFLVPNTYYGLNPAPEVFRHRGLNRYERYAKTTVDDKEIERLRRFLVDFDANKPLPDIMATKAERQAAHDSMYEARDWLLSQGWPGALIEADSGNGGHLVFNIDLPPLDKDILSKCLKALNKRWAAVDLTTFNPARITKAYGTMVRKGEGIDDRPHREASILSHEADAPMVEREMIEAIIGEPTKATSQGFDYLDDMRLEADRLNKKASDGTHPLAAYRGDLKTLDIERLWASKGLEIYRHKAGLIELQCPWWEGHSTGNDGTAVFTEEGRYPAFTCRHKTCIDHKTMEMLEWFGKDLVDAHCGKTFAKALRPDGIYQPSHPGEATRENLPMGDHDTVVSLSNPMGTARKLVDNLWMHGNVMTIRNRRKSWWIWNGRYYEEYLEESIRNTVWKWLEVAKIRRVVRDGGEPVLDDNGKKKYEEAACNPEPKHVSAVMDALRSICSIATDEMPCYLGTEPFPDASSIIAVGNGLIDKEAYIAGLPNYMRPHTPLWFSNSVLNFDFDPSATCPTWEWFVDDVMEGDKDSVDCIQQWMGLNLTSDTSYQKVMLFIGPKRNGKGTLIRRLQSILGQRSFCTPSFTSVAGKFGRHVFIGKTAAIFPDATMPKSVDAGIVTEFIKNVSGEDHVIVDRKNKDEVSVKLNTKLTIVSNSMPYFPDVTNAIGDRFIVIPFNVSYVGREDTTLNERMAKEDPGILRWALEGLRSLRKAGRFKEPAVGMSFKDQLNDMSSPHSACIKECFVMKEGEMAQKDQVRAIMNGWLTQNGHKELSAIAVTRALTAINPKINPDGKATIEGHPVRVYTNIGINPEAKKELRYYNDTNNLTRLVGSAG